MLALDSANEILTMSPVNKNIEIEKLHEKINHSEVLLSATKWKNWVI